MYMHAVAMMHAFHRIDINMFGLGDTRDGTGLITKGFSPQLSRQIQKARLRHYSESVSV